MRWVYFVFSYSVKSFVIFFLLGSVFFGGYSLVYSKVNFGVFKFYLDFSEILLISLRISMFVFITLVLNVVFIQIPKEKANKSYTNKR